MTKMVQLANDAYQLLRDAKEAGESFSDVVRRLTDKPKMLDLTGLRSKKEIDAAERMIKEVDALERRQMDEELRRRAAGH